MTDLADKQAAYECGQLGDLAVLELFGQLVKEDGWLQGQYAQQIAFCIAVGLLTPDGEPTTAALDLFRQPERAGDADGLG